MKIEIENFKLTDEMDDFLRTELNKINNVVFFDIKLEWIEERKIYDIGLFMKCLDGQIETFYISGKKFHKTIEKSVIEINKNLERHIK